MKKVVVFSQRPFLQTKKTNFYCISNALVVFLQPINQHNKQLWYYIKEKEIRFIVSIAVLLFFPLFCNAAATEEPEEEILFITSYNSDTKYTYDNISTFIETYTQLGGRYSTIVENMNATDLTQAHQWKKTINRYFRQTSES